MIDFNPIVLATLVRKVWRLLDILGGRSSGRFATTSASTGIKHPQVQLKHPKSSPFGSFHVLYKYDSDTNITAQIQRFSSLQDFHDGEAKPYHHKALCWTLPSEVPAN